MKNINIAIPDDVKKSIEEYSKDSGIILKKIVELALTEYMKKKGYLK